MSETPFLLPSASAWRPFAESKRLSYIDKDLAAIPVLHALHSRFLFLKRFTLFPGSKYSLLLAFVLIYYLNR